MEYRVHKIPPLGPILSQISPIHAPQPVSWRTLQSICRSPRHF